jgi:hypothetical protein
MSAREVAWRATVQCDCHFSQPIPVRRSLPNRPVLIGVIYVSPAAVRKQRRGPLVPVHMRTNERTSFTSTVGGEHTAKLGQGEVSTFAPTFSRSEQW